MFTTFFDGRRIGVINKTREISVGQRLGIVYFDVSNFQFYEYPTVTNLAKAHGGGSTLSCGVGAVDRAYFDGRDLHVSHEFTVLDVYTTQVKKIPDIESRGV